MSHLNRFYLILCLMVVATATMVFFQYKRSQGIDINTTSQPILDANFTEIPISADEKTFGNPGAPLLIVGFFDLNEKTDQTTAQTIVKFIENNPQSAQFYLKNFPQSKLFGGDRTLVHRALICAGEQKKYWEYLATLSTINKINFDSLGQIATDLKLNYPTWQTCWGNPATAQIVANDFALATNIGIKNAPTIFVNNKKVNLYKDLDLMDLLNKFIEK